MKSVIAVFCLVAYAATEPPPSNSYLPPSPAGRGQGYPSGGPGAALGGPGAALGGPGAGLGGPQVIAARTQGLGHQHGANANGFGRATTGVRPGATGRGRFTSPSHGQGLDHLDHDHGYDRNASPFGRNALDDASDEPASYNFGYMVNDYQEGTDFGHHEERENERAEGEYHVVLPDGRKQIVSYEADERGFKPRVSYEDSDASLRSGYDSNASNLGDATGRLSNGHHSNGVHGGGHHGNGYSNGGSGGY